MAKAVLFGTSTCPWRPRARRYLADRGISAKEVDVERGRKAAADMVGKTGQMEVPVIKIGSKWVVGFDRPAIDKALANGG